MDSGKENTLTHVDVNGGALSRDAFHPSSDFVEQAMNVGGSYPPPLVATQEVGGPATKRARPWLRWELSENLWIAIVGALAVIVAAIVQSLIPYFLADNAQASPTTMLVSTATTIVSTPSPTQSSITKGIRIPVGHNSVNIDGYCDGQAEYEDALSFNFPDYNQQQGSVYFKHDGEFLLACMKAAVGTNPERFAALEFAAENEHTTPTIVAQLVASLTTGKTSATQGLTGWSAAATTGSYDFAEYRIPIRATGGSPCAKLFRMSVWHYWVSRQADDYSWLNQPGIGWNDPSVWPYVELTCKD